MSSHNGGIPFRATGGVAALSFCPDCSKVIFTVSVLVPVFHPHRLADTFLKTATLFVIAFRLIFKPL